MTLQLQAHFEDESEAWLRDILANSIEEARKRVSLLLDEARLDENGCLVTDTLRPRKVRFRGRQVAAYRFIHCVRNEQIAALDQVVRHRCHNRRCINPEHLHLGSQADNKRDDWEHWANGMDWDLL